MRAKIRQKGRNGKRYGLFQHTKALASIRCCELPPAGLAAPTRPNPDTRQLLFQGSAAVVVRGKASVFMGLDFFANGGVLLFPKRLPPVLDAVVEMHLTHVASANGTRAATGHHEQQQRQKTEYRLHGSEGTEWAEASGRAQL